MITAATAANFFIDIANSREDDIMTNLKLNKLLYIAQGCHLARTGLVLFGEQIEAWNFGPVIPSIYHKYKVCGRAPIMETDDDYNASELSSEELETLVDTMREFGQYTGNYLVKLTHETGTPWHRFFSVGQNIVIPPETIKEYFIVHPVPKFEVEGECAAAFPHEWYDASEDEEWEKYLS